MSWAEFKEEYLQMHSWLECIGSYIGSLLARSISQLGLFEYIFIFAVVALFVALLVKAVTSIHTKYISLWKVAVIPIVVVLIYSAFFAMLIWHIPLSGVPDKLREGAFGDSFGTLNALFSGLAFAGVIITLLMQKVDLAESRKQIYKQQTDAQFYNLLNLQQQVVQGFDLHIGERVVQGRDCFRNWSRKLKQRYKPTKHSGVPGSASITAYNFVLNSHLGDLSLYFRSLYTVFRFLDEMKGVDEAERKQYSVVVRSLLSDYELLFLFYNCLSWKGEKFMVYAKSYSLFDNLDVNLLLNLDDVLLMDVQAYGSNREALEIIKYHSP